MYNVAKRLPVLQGSGVCAGSGSRRACMLRTQDLASQVPVRPQTPHCELHGLGALGCAQRCKMRMCHVPGITLLLNWVAVKELTIIYPNIGTW